MKSKDGNVISKQKYILDLLKKTRNLRCKPAQTSMDPNLVQHQSGEVILVDMGMYQRLEGKLICLSYTKPDIAFSVSIVSQYVNSPNENYLRVVKRILRYLKGTSSHWLLFKKSSNKIVQLYTNASWAKN